MTAIIPHFGDARQEQTVPPWGGTREPPSRILPVMGKSPKAQNNLKRLREAAGMTQEQAAEAFGLSKGGYIKIEDGDRGLKTDRIAKAAQIFGVQPADILVAGVDAATVARTPNPVDAIEQAQRASKALAGLLLPVNGEVAAGRWLAVDDHVDESRFDPAPIVPDPRWRSDAQFGLVVRGTSINKFAVDGDVLHCVDIAATGQFPVSGEMVVVEQIRDGGHLRERTAKIYHVGEGEMVELRAFSDDPRWDTPIYVPHRVYSHAVEKGLIVEVRAFVVGSYRPMQTRRNGR